MSTKKWHFYEKNAIEKIEFFIRRRFGVDSQFRQVRRVPIFG
jgi:hypothetical protein